MCAKIFFLKNKDIIFARKKVTGQESYLKIGEIKTKKRGKLDWD